MLDLPPAIVLVLRLFESVFSERVWDWVQVLVIGAIMQWSVLPALERASLLARRGKNSPDLERLHALRDGVAGFGGPPERLDRRSPTPPPQVTPVLSVKTARWAVEAARRVIEEFHSAAARERPDGLD